MRSGVRLIAAATAILVPFLQILPAQAGGEEPPRHIIAEPIIKACGEPQQKYYDTGGTSAIAYGVGQELACLKKAILENWQDLGRTDNQAELAKTLDALAEPYTNIFSLIYEANRTCPGFCGNMNSSTGAFQLLKAYQEILEAMEDASR